MLTAHTAGPADFTRALRPFLIDAEAVSQAFQGVRRFEDAERILDVYAQASTTDVPAWYRPDRPGDRFRMTLASGEVLAWAQIAPGEPRELMAWSGAWQGSIIWRENGPRLVHTRR